MNSQVSQATSSSLVAAKRRHSTGQGPVHIFGGGVLADLERLCMSDLYSDVSFYVEDQRLPAHRLVLAARSEYFRALLYGGKSEPKERQIRLDVPLQSFKVILGYVYSGDLSISTLDVDASFKVLGLANLYGMQEVELALATHLMESLALSNVCTILNTARLFNFAQLTMKCLNFMDRNSAALLKHDTFQILAKESLEEVLRRGTFADYELHIFQAVHKWSLHNPSEEMKSVLALIRFPLIAVKDLVGTVRGSGIVESETIFDAIDEAMNRR
ncbi:BTB/POZ domain-containing protein 9-like [Drosophila obscura]|uniref:BTB/POZ domain-containing protein 9-like n=1 Tax=Drosophila obscura TaxID=7282 RepID=UPI001BB2613A|nr:BTB/POZ domain-containing protein 9-like [Drosophila obscura]